MFEQTLMPATHNKPWTLGASITLQAAIVGSMVLYSALHVDMMPLNIARQLELPFPATPKPEFVKVISASIASRPSSLALPVRPFTMPSRIPDGVPEINDIGSDAPVLSLNSGTAPGAVFGDSILGAIATPHAIPRPAQPTVTHSPAVKSSAPVRVSIGVMEAKIIKRVMPIYPQLAKNARISGRVHLIGIIAKNGTIQKLDVLDGHPLLAGAALDAVKQWIYRPTLLNGEPVDVITPIEVNFTLTQ